MTDIAIPQWKINQEKRQTKERLAWNEEQILKHTSGIAVRLKEIHDDKLYKEDYPSFEAYCQDKWGIGRIRAYQMLSAEGTRLALSDAVQGNSEALKTLSGMNEAQLREVSKFKGKEVEVIVEASKEKKLSVPKLQKIAVEVGAIPASQLAPKPKKAQVKHICPACGNSFESQ